MSFFFKKTSWPIKLKKFLYTLEHLIPDGCDEIPTFALYHPLLTLVRIYRNILILANEPRLFTRLPLVGPLAIERSWTMNVKMVLSTSTHVIIWLAATPVGIPSGCHIRPLPYTLRHHITSLNPMSTICWFYSDRKNMINPKASTAKDTREVTPPARGSADFNSYLMCIEINMKQMNPETIIFLPYAKTLGPGVQGMHCLNHLCRQGGVASVLQWLHQGEEVCSAAAPCQPSSLATASLVLVLGLMSWNRQYLVKMGR